MKKQLLSILMAVMMLLALCPAAALADGSLTLEKAVYEPQTDLPDSDELFSAYLEKQLGGGISLFSTGLRTAGSRLTGDAKAVYDGLKPYMEKIAAGEMTSTVITIGQNVGVEEPMIAHEFTCKMSELGMKQVLEALLTDLPYEMYWFDKTDDQAISYSYYQDSNQIILYMEISFAVAEAYQGADDHTLNARPASVATAVANAKKVVSDNAGKSDYEKLKAYKEYICGAVDYNHDAAADDYTGSFGDPWQLIHVFDGDASTKVVCEGYAKAFQYLCDMTAWNGDVQCYSVSGNMTGGTGAGDHMWNIVTIGGESYLVDVTNSDDGSVGQDGELFMGGTAGSITGGYTFDCGSQDVKFTYDIDTMVMWGTGSDSILKLMGENYDPSKEPVIETYTVTFVDGQGNTLSTQTVKSGEAATAPSGLSREGYTFTGWDKTFANITADTTITAQWTINTYTVTFMDGQGNKLATKTVEHGKAATAPTGLSREGYTFAGWDKEFNKITADLTVTAQWTINTYTVTFMDGQGNKLATKTVEHGEAATAPTEPSREGYAFSGWDKEFNKITADLTVTAKWTVKQYTITFNSNGGSAVAAITKDYGAAVTAPAAPEREGYTFAGWDAEIPATMPAKNLTLTAKWTVKQYTITFNSNGGSAVAAITKDYGAAVTAPAAPEREGYTFAGWDAEIPATMPAKNLTLNAKWTVNTYTVTFVDGNGKTLSTQTVEYGKAAKAPADPTWAGHTFTGWDKTFDKIIADTTVTAKWDVNVYTVTFVDGQGNKLSEQKVESGKAATAPTDPTREGYTFAGWDKAFTNITADTTVTAKWTVNTYTVTFVDGNGKTLSTQTVEYGKAAKAPADPTWAGHTFTGWDKTFDKITADTTVTAKWDVITYTVTVTNGDGSGKYAAGAAVTIVAKAPEAGMKFTGWQGLDGLTITQGSAGTVSLTFTMPEKNVTVSAVFEKQEEEKFTVSFDGNGGTGSIDAVEMTAGTFTLPACTLTAPEGKQFKAWRINGVEYAVGSKISVAANMTVEAVWENIPVQGSAPVITAPEKDQVVSVNEGETGKMSITAKDATAYQWYINRQDGKGYVTIKGAESASYTTSKVEAANDGFTYYCVASNQFGQNRSAVFTLEVVVEPEVPETGDSADIALWLALLFTGMAGIVAMTSKARKASGR